MKWDGRILAVCGSMAMAYGMAALRETAVKADRNNGDYCQ